MDVRVVSSQKINPRYSKVIEASPVFYGWVIMLVGTLGLIMTMPGQTNLISIFIDHFIDDLDVTRSLVSALYAGATLLGSLALPFVGRFIDRYGSQKMIVWIALLFGLACILMSSVRNALMLGVGFLGLRMLGQGSLTLVSQNVINQWWVRRRGAVMGMSGLALSLVGLGGFPILTNWLISQLGWESAFIVLGVMVLVTILPLGYLFLRDNPELYGQYPDGRGPSQAEDDSDNDDDLLQEAHWELREVLRSPVFWILIAGVALISMLTTGLYFHMVSIFASNGHSADVAASVFLPISLTIALTNLVGGVLIDHIPARFLLAGALFFQAICLVLAQAIPGTEEALLYGIVLGLTGGLWLAVNNVMWAQYFGRLHLGSITGVTSTILVAASALGPVPLGVAYDVFGTYNPILTFLAIFPVLLGVLTLFTRQPKQQVMVA